MTIFYVLLSQLTFNNHIPSALICLRPFRPSESETDSRGHVGLQAPQINVYFLFDSIVFSIFCF